MPDTTINGINVHYETYGSGPPLLMLAPGGFDSTIEKWSNVGVWPPVNPLESFSRRYTCIAYDRREAGQSGGRVERLSWALYALEAKGLLEHLGIDRAVVMGACMGCTVAATFAVAYPESTVGLVLHYPVGGALWRINMRQRFAEHAAFVQEQGLDAVVKLAQEKGPTFQAGAVIGPWGSTIAGDEAFAKGFAAQDPERYAALIKTMGPTLFDRDTAPGAEPEELMALKVPAVIIPGDDPAHATSAARYLKECLPHAEYHDYAPAEQTPERLCQWILSFLDSHAV